MPKHIGIDLDNTIIDFSPTFKILGRDIGLSDESSTRENFRNQIRSQNDEVWQKYQSVIYTDGLFSAIPAQGLIDFLELCLKFRIKISIVSHKTNFTDKKYGAKDLIRPAQYWLEKNGIVPELISPQNVHFCASRLNKIEKIVELGCDIFIDDLVEVLSSPELPAGLIKVLFAQKKTSSGSDTGEYLVMNFPQMIQWLHLC